MAILSFQQKQGNRGLRCAGPLPGMDILERAMKISCEIHHFVKTNLMFLLERDNYLETFSTPVSQEGPAVALPRECRKFSSFRVCFHYNKEEDNCLAYKQTNHPAVLRQ